MFFVSSSCYLSVNKIYLSLPREKKTPAVACFFFVFVYICFNISTLLNFIIIRLCNSVDIKFSCVFYLYNFYIVSFVVIIILWNSIKHRTCIQTASLFFFIIFIIFLFIHIYGVYSINWRTHTSIYTIQVLKEQQQKIFY